MEKDILTILAEVIVALSVITVWSFRIENVKQEFKEYGYSDKFRNLIGLFKIMLSLLLIVAVWFPQYAIYPATLMGLLMIGSQYSHYKVSHKWQKFLPSFCLLILCTYIVGTHF